MAQDLLEGLLSDLIDQGVVVRALKPVHWSIANKTALAEAEAFSEPGETEIVGREDRRDDLVMTIDPADAKDHDDAVHAEPDPNPANEGGFILTVAIADVAAYVGTGSALDQEALRRGNSVYFPDRVVPMLPEQISNDLCSLRPLQDRPALAVRLVLDAQGGVIQQKLGKLNEIDTFCPRSNS